MDIDMVEIENIIKSNLQFPSYYNKTFGYIAEEKECNRFSSFIYDHSYLTYLKDKEEFTLTPVIKYDYDIYIDELINYSNLDWVIEFLSKIKEYVSVRYDPRHNEELDGEIDKTTYKEDICNIELESDEVGYCRLVITVFHTLTDKEKIEYDNIVEQTRIKYEQYINKQRELDFKKYQELKERFDSE